MTFGSSMSSCTAAEYEVLDRTEKSCSETETFVRLVIEGGAVKEEHYVREGLMREGAKIVFAKIGDSIVGVAARKVPSEGYRSGIEGQSKSGYSLPEDIYPFELGYVTVVREHRGLGIAKGLVEQVLVLAEGKGMFATTSNSAMQEILSRSGFFSVGNSWTNDWRQELHLMINFENLMQRST